MIDKRLADDPTDKQRGKKPKLGQSRNCTHRFAGTRLAACGVTGWGHRVMPAGRIRAVRGRKGGWLVCSVLRIGRERENRVNET